MDASEDVSISLLGGDTAFPVKAAGKKQPTQTKFFTLETGDGDVPTWDVKYKIKDTEMKLATLSLEDKSLNFRWEADGEIPPKDVPMLGNCALKLEYGEKSHVLGLREPIVLETLVLNPKNGTASIKGGKLPLPLPSLDCVYVEIVRVGNLPDDSPDVQIPEPKKASELGPKTPICINFSFKDSNSNLQTPFLYSFTPTFGQNFSGTMLALMAQNGTPIPNSGKMYLQAVTQSQDPQIDIQLNNLRKDIDARKKELADKPGWQGDAAKTSEIAQKEMQIWMVGVLKNLVDADVEYRIYADFNGEQMDLITSHFVSPDEKKTPKKGGKARSEDEEGDSMGSNDIGGMKF